MGLIKGALSLTRYRVREEPPETLTDEYVSGRLAKNAFLDIENGPEERSLGWVEFFNHLGTDFNPATYRIGGLLAFTLRLDSRRLPPPVLKRYCAIREALYTAQLGHPPNSLVRREMKEAVKAELLTRALVSTELMEVAWLRGKRGLAGRRRRKTAGTFRGTLETHFRPGPADGSLARDLRPGEPDRPAQAGSPGGPA